MIIPYTRKYGHAIKIRVIKFSNIVYISGKNKIYIFLNSSNPSFCKPLLTMNQIYTNLSKGFEDWEISYFSPSVQYRASSKAQPNKSALRHINIHYGTKICCDQNICHIRFLNFFRFYGLFLLQYKKHCWAEFNECSVFYNFQIHLWYSCEYCRTNCFHSCVSNLFQHNKRNHNRFIVI